MKRLVWAVLFCAPVLLLATPAQAQQDPEGTLYFGYSYFRVDLEDAMEGDSHGIEADYTYFLQRRVGFTVSASAHWGTLDAPPNIYGVGEYDSRQVTFLAGPHFVLFRGMTAEAGLRLLAGATHRILDTSVGSLELENRWEFTAAPSLLFEFRLADTIWLRVPQATMLFYRFGSEWQADWRVSAGIVIRGGELLQ